MNIEQFLTGINIEYAFKAAEIRFYSECKNRLTFGNGRKTNKWRTWEAIDNGIPILCYFEPNWNK